MKKHKKSKQEKAEQYFLGSLSKKNWTTNFTLNENISIILELASVWAIRRYHKLSVIGVYNIPNLPVKFSVSAPTAAFSQMSISEAIRIVY